MGIKLSPGNITLRRAERERLPHALHHILCPVLGGKELYSKESDEDLIYSINPDMINERDLREFEKYTGVKLTISQIRHSRPAKELAYRLKQCEMAFAWGETSHVHLAFARVPLRNALLKHKLIVFPTDSISLFGVLQSNVHSCWAYKYGIRRKEDLCYSPKRCSQTFPLPESIGRTASDDLRILERISEAYYTHRHSIMTDTQSGMTDIYNRFHDESDEAPDLVRLREMQVEMDMAVAAAYRWTKFHLGHDFHETKQGIRFTISEAARREVLARLLKLNHERYAEEVAQGLHSKKRGAGSVGRGAKKTGGRGRKGKSSSEPSLFGEED